MEPAEILVHALRVKVLKQPENTDHQTHGQHEADQRSYNDEYESESPAARDHSVKTMLDAPKMRDVRHGSARVAAQKSVR